jgi:CRP-like cAMP-binding protein
LHLSPGGSKILLDKAGRDATEDFEVAHGPNNLRVESGMIPYRIGKISGCPESLSPADKRAFARMVSYLHSICEIRNAFFLNVDIFEGKFEAIGFAHSLASRFRVHEQFLTSVVPMLEDMTSSFCRNLRQQIPQARFFALDDGISAALVAFKHELSKLSIGGASPGPRLYVATELCHIECDFLSQFLDFVIRYVSAVEAGLDAGELVGQPADEFATLSALCDEVRSAIERRLRSVSSLKDSSDRTSLLELVKTSLSRDAKMKAVAKKIDFSELVLVKCKQGDFIFRGHDIINHVYVLYEGEAAAVDRGIEIEGYTSGATFGSLSHALRVSPENNNLGNGVMPYSVTVSSRECDVVAIPNAYLSSLARAITEDGVSPGTRLPPPSPTSGKWKKAGRFAIISQRISVSAISNHIRRSNLLYFLPPAMCEVMARNGSNVTVPAGKELYSVGTPARSVMILISGCFNVVKDGMVVWKYNREGHMFGEQVVALPPETQPCYEETLVAAEESQCFIIPGDVIREKFLGPFIRQMKALELLDDVLKKEPFFSSMKPAARYGLAKEFRQIKVGRYETLFEESEAGDCCYIVVSGRLQTRTLSGKRNELGPGDYTGMDQILKESARTATCEGTELSICWTLNHNGLQDAMGLDVFKELQSRNTAG